MEIITKEHLAKTFIKNIVTEFLKEESVQDVLEISGSVDQAAWDNFSLLGKIVYDLIGEMYGDFDAVVDEMEK